MKFLFVDCFLSSKQYPVPNYINHLKNLILQAQQANKLELGLDDEIIFETRAFKDLSDLLYDPKTLQLNDKKHKFLDMNAKTKFEAIDMVFIIGDVTTQAWDFTLYQVKYFEQMKQVQTLVRLCMQVSKPLIGLGLGLNLLNLYSSTGLPFDYVFYVDRTEEERSELKAEKYKKALIDEQSGDYYLYNAHQDKLNLVGHIGFFNNYQLKRKQFDVSPMRQNFRLTSNECMAKVRKIYVQHPVVKGILTNQFKVIVRQAQWSSLQQLPQFNQKQTFKTVVEDAITKHALVIEMSNAFGILFDINVNDPNSQFIFKNAVAINMQKIIDNLFNFQKDSPKCIYEEVSKRSFFGGAAANISQQTPLKKSFFTMRGQENHLKYSGQNGISNNLSQSDLIDNNTLDNMTTESKANNRSVLILPKQIKNIYSDRRDSQEFTDNQRSRSFLQQSTENIPQINCNDKFEENFFKKILNQSRNLRSPNYDQPSSQNQQRIQFTIDNSIYQNSYAESKQISIRRPSKLALRSRASIHQSFNNIKPQNRQMSENNLKRNESTAYQDKNSPMNKLYRKYKEFQEQEAQFQERDLSQVNKSMQATILGEKLYKEGYRPPVDKKKWISSSDFKANVGIASTGNGFTKSTETYVTRDPSENPLIHQFRDKSPKKWLYGSFKI
ncbi:UNKNOWN [Stylonychia lemnae]|uniref:Uncharacterized protein n=1 Tax=Stylonychia lemnae TaxID=5949 RepID=A0A078B984_STYLE|nr:UNKNOWN [Stylonychia lemnae]|eukprot:CDW91080.1 UNKNOWN [Stylonychia lemnae]